VSGSVPRILLSAGEPSGDLHGAAVARALRERWPKADLYGLGGPRMQAEGVRLLAHVDELAVMGFAEVAGRLPYFLRLLRQIRGELRSKPPDLVVPIDYPGFNVRLARAARARRIPVLYYIAPQVWAWHRSRIHELARVADQLAVILPFEAQLFRDAGAAVDFVGHPLLERAPPSDDRHTFAGRLGLDPDRPVLALFPGSRRQEVQRHAALFVEAAERVRKSRPEVQPVIATSAAVPASAYASFRVPLTDDGWALLHHARAALVKSGTGTLEAALAGTPLVIAYRMHPLSFALARRLVRVDHIGLVNLVAGKRIAPELVQTEATTERLAAALLPLLDGASPQRQSALQALAEVRGALQPADGASTTSARVAELAARLLALPQ
jgi:lipid-A-disaccharide synthase